MDAAQHLGIEFQTPYLEARLAIMNGSRRNYPSNGINFASAGSGVLHQTNLDSVIERLYIYNDCIVKFFPFCLII